MEDPRSFLAGLRDGAVLDEVHRFPELPSWLLSEVDEDDRPGRFVLTASQDLARDAAGAGVLVYGGSEAQTRQETHVRPWFAV